MTKRTLRLQSVPAAEFGAPEGAVCRCVFCCIEHLPFGATLARQATRIAARRLGRVDVTSAFAEIPGERN